MYFLTLNSIYGKEVVVNMANVTVFYTDLYESKDCTTIEMCSDNREVRVTETPNQILQALPPGFA